MVANTCGHTAMGLDFWVFLPKIVICKFSQFLPIFANFLQLLTYSYLTTGRFLMKFSVMIPDTHVHFGMVFDFWIFLQKNCYLQIFKIFGNFFSLINYDC